MKLRAWGLAVIGVAAFAALVWYAGPLLVLAGQAPLASVQARLLVIGIFALQYFAQKLWNARKARLSNERVVEGLNTAAQPATSAESVQVRERFAAALAELRHARFGARGGSWSSLSWKFGRSYLYQLPWYMIIGAPGAGKTTALLNSNLNFPLAEKFGRGSVRGYGGTRNCDWWFTDEAVLIDTAGRYTTHESDPAADRRAWDDFLQLLRRTRPRRPLNGLLLAVSLSDLLGFNAAQLAEHAQVLRARLDEVQAALGVRIPVYVLLTKCDLLPGFVDWFGALDRKDRDSVWGHTFDLGAGDSGAAVADFAASFEGLVNHLADGLVERLQAERDSQRRARIFSLPRQLRALREPLDALLRGAFGTPAGAGPSAILLRGIYLTSGTQEGTPIDRALSAFGRELGLERQILPPNQSSGRSYFLKRLLTEVVFAEAELSGQTPLRQRWQRRLLAASIFSLQLCAAVAATWWLTGYFRSVDDIAELSGEVAQMRSVVDAVPVHADSDPRALLPALDALRALAHEPARARGPTELLDMGAAARMKLAAAGHAAYDRMLLGAFQRQIAQSVDATLRTGADMNVQYEALKTAAMLTDAAHFDPAGVKVFVWSYWDSTIAPPLTAAERTDLRGHLDALLDAGAVGSGLALQPALVDSVRRRLKTQTGGQRIALRLAVLFDLHPAADFTVASLGPAATEVFAGGETPESNRVPGRETIEAYRNVVISEVPRLATQLASEAGWVLGTPSTSAGADAAEFMNAYRAGYARDWSRFVEDLHLKPAADNQEAIRQAQSLAAADGPLAQALGAIVQQTPLRLETDAEGPISPTDPLADRLTMLAHLVARDTSGSAPLDTALQSFKDLHTLRARPAPGAAGEQLARIIASAKGEPEPVRSMLLALAVLPAAAPAAESHASGTALSRQIAARLGVACLRLVAGFFPFDRNSTRDASLENFSRMFGPKGEFDQVFGQLLESRVDTSSDTWQSLTANGPAEVDVERFHAAARIRDTFFARGAPHPAVKLTFRPLNMDPDIDRFQLDIDGQTIRYAHGPLTPTVVNWPGPQGHARIEATPAGLGAALDYTGPWAVFRLMDHAAIQEAGTPARFHVVFDIGGRHVSFEVESDSGVNPFRFRELEHFDCPMAGQ